MNDGNTPAQFKCDIIKYWKLTEKDQSLHYLLNLYFRYASYFDIR